MKYFLFVGVAIASVACSSPDTDKAEGTDTTETALVDNSGRPIAIESGKFWEEDGKKYLYGGEEEYMHFDITGYTLKDEQFHYGIGREAFPALLEPEFMTVTDADTIFADTARFLFLQYGNTKRAYSIEDLTHHEVVNDIVEGKPVMAAYCVLADLGAIYDRTIGGREYTFALSGYTYWDPEVWDGMDGFVMWDRETESLWWPLIGKAVSGPMQETHMVLLDEQYWSQTTWKWVKGNHPDTDVLIPGQDFERPTNWPGYEDVPTVENEGEGIAPEWGENSDQ